MLVGADNAVGDDCVFALAVLEFSLVVTLELDTDDTLLELVGAGNAVDDDCVFGWVTVSALALTPMYKVVDSSTDATPTLSLRKP